MPDPAITDDDRDRLLIEMAKSLELLFRAIRTADPALAFVLRSATQEGRLQAARERFEEKTDA